MRQVRPFFPIGRRHAPGPPLTGPKIMRNAMEYTRGKLFAKPAARTPTTNPILNNRTLAVGIFPNAGRDPAPHNFAKRRKIREKITTVPAITSEAATVPSVTVLVPPRGDVLHRVRADSVANASII